MTNFIPQLAANNQGPWEELESYCRTLAAQGNEIYIVTGPVGNIGTIARRQSYRAAIYLESCVWFCRTATTICRESIAAHALSDKSCRIFRRSTSMLRGGNFA